MSLATDPTAAAGMERDARGFLGHPKGLAFIAFTEAWERFSFFGMQALLVLYMVTHLFKPGVIDHVWGVQALRTGMQAALGPLSAQGFATQLFGFYVGLIYLTPVLGGLIGDRLTGRRTAVLAGAALMAMGHFLMAVEAAFLPALAALICGAGLLKGNLAAQVGGLYAKDDPRRDAAFSVYCISINIGAFVAPLVCGTLGELYGWHYGFAAAGIGMLISIGIYLAGARHLPPERARTGEAAPRLQAGDGKVIAAILLVLAITALYWIAQTQVWNTYPLWARDRVDREVLGLSFPVTWFQSVDSLAVIALAPMVIWFWKWQRGRGGESGDLGKIGIGCAVFAAACLWLTLGEALAGHGKINILWPLAFHFICGWAYLYVGPIALALTSKTAPPAVNAMLIGVYYVALFVGGIGSGWLGRFYETMSPAGFWAMHAAIVGLASLLLLVLHRPIRTALRLDGAEAGG